MENKKKKELWIPNVTSISLKRLGTLLYVMFVSISLYYNHLQNFSNVC